jgi:hypothetical protein
MHLSFDVRKALNAPWTVKVDSLIGMSGSWVIEEWSRRRRLTPLANVLASYIVHASETLFALVT